MAGPDIVTAVFTIIAHMFTNHYVGSLLDLHDYKSEEEDFGENTAHMFTIYIGSLLRRFT